MYKAAFGNQVVWEENQVGKKGKGREEGRREREGKRDEGKGVEGEVKARGGERSGNFLHP